MKALGIAIAVVLGIAFLALVVVPAFVRQKVSRPSSCLGNLHALIIANRVYVSDYGQFPDAAHWMDEFSNGGYVTNAKFFHCPYDPAHKYSYAMNSALGGVKPPDPKNLPHVIVFFSSDSGKRNAHGSPATGCRPHKGEGDMCFIGYADGDVEALAPGQRPR
jgi:hypothetical protein